MKKVTNTLYIVSVLFVTIVFTSCGNNERGNSSDDNCTSISKENAVLKQQVAQLADSIDKMPTREKIIREMENEKNAQFDALASQLFTDTLKFSALPDFKEESPEFAVSNLREYDANDFGFYSQRAANVLGIDFDTLKLRLKNPAVLDKLFTDNKDRIQIVVNGLKMFGQWEPMKQELISFQRYMDKSAPAPVWVAFNTYYAKFSKEESIQIGSKEWEACAKALNLNTDDNALIHHYQYYSYVRRRQLEGGDALRNEYTKILRAVTVL